MQTWIGIFIGSAVGVGTARTAINALPIPSRRTKRASVHGVQRGAKHRKVQQPVTSATANSGISSTLLAPGCLDIDCHSATQNAVVPPFSSFFLGFMSWIGQVVRGGRDAAIIFVHVTTLVDDAGPIGLFKSFPPHLCVGFLFFVLYPFRLLLRLLFRRLLFVTHTQLCHTPSFTHNFVTYHLSHTPSFTHNFVTHTQLCHTPSLSLSLSLPLTHTHLSHAHNFVTHYLSHKSFSHIIVIHIFVTQGFVAHNTFVTHHLSHTHTYTHLCHTPSLSHTIVHAQLCHTHTQLCHTPSFTHNFVAPPPSLCVAGLALADIHLRFALMALGWV